MRLEKQVLTDRFVRGLKPAASGKRVEHWDAALPGFGVRVTDRGAISFVVYTRWPATGQPARRTLGDATRLPLAAARQKARDWLTLVEQGIDPREHERQAELDKQRRRLTTFEAVAEAWFGQELKSQRKAVEVERDVRREFFVQWGKRPITDITSLDVRNLIRAKAGEAPAQARNLLGYAKRLFSWAVDQQIYGIAESPAERLRPSKIVGKKIIRRRVLNEAEMRALWQASTKLDSSAVGHGRKHWPNGYPFGPLFRMLMLTGQRKSEVAHARWREFDLSKKLWTIPAERMKMDAAHVVPLSDDVIALLEALPRFKTGDYLFSTTFGTKPVNGFSKAKVRLDRMMLSQFGSEPEHWTIHDIRRTMRTGLSALPIPDRVRELVIAHAQPGLHKIYDQYAYLDEKRRALDLWSARLRSVVDPTAMDNVLLLRQGA